MSAKCFSLCYIGLGLLPSLYDLYVSLTYSWNDLQRGKDILNRSGNFFIPHQKKKFNFAFNPKNPTASETLEKIASEYEKIKAKYNNNYLKCKWYNIVDIEAKGNFVFVIMPIDRPELETYYQDLIKPFFNNNNKWGLTCWRSDDDKIPEKISDQIFTYIVKSRFIIAEITQNNRNVWYELGISHALNKNVLILTQEDLDDLPFDIKHHKAYRYTDEQELRNVLEKNVPYFLNNFNQ